MTLRSRTHLLLPLLTLSLALAWAASSQAQDRNYQGSIATSASLQVSFGTSPHWAPIRGTRVEEIPRAERPDYDMFRFDGSYYAYNNNRWYMSHLDHGDFVMIDERSVPSELSTVPREHWQRYPAAWADGTSASLQVSFGTSPHWAAIHGSRVEEIPQAERPDYDMFRFDGSYYAYDNDRWYVSRQDHGEFTMLDARSVPSELSTVPRDHWQRYPSGWSDMNNTPAFQESGDRSAMLQVSFGNKPHWTGVRGTRVKMIRPGERQDFDMFRYGGNYYAYKNSQWYTSRQARGGYAMIDDRAVPYELSKVSREHWQNYPPEWSDRNARQRRDQDGYRH